MLAWEHTGGFSLDASIRIAAHDRAGLERLLRYCARPPFALERLEWRNAETEGEVIYHLPRPAPDGRTVVRLSPLDFLDRLATLLPPPLVHRHRYHGVFAPNAPLRPLVTALASVEAGTTFLRASQTRSAARFPPPGNRAQPGATSPPAGPPEFEFKLDAGAGFDQTPSFDSAEPEPIPELVMDQTHSW